VWPDAPVDGHGDRHREHKDEGHALCYQETVLHAHHDGEEPRPGDTQGHAHDQEGSALTLDARPAARTGPGTVPAPRGGATGGLVLVLCRAPPFLFSAMLCHEPLALRRTG
jgi:hypothetical protein